MGNSRVACRCVEKPTATTTTDAAYLPAETLTEHYEPWGASIAADILPVPLPTLPNALPSINTPQNRFTYNGKELQTDIGLFEYGFRWYDPMNVRFTSVDPLANDYTYKTPYDYAENEPIAGVDLDGAERKDSKKEESIFAKFSDYIEKATRGINITSTLTFGPQVGVELEAKGSGLGIDFSPASVKLMEHSLGRTNDGKYSETSTILNTTKTETENSKSIIQKKVEKDIKGVEVENKIGGTVSLGSTGVGIEIGQKQKINFCDGCSSDVIQYTKTEKGFRGFALETTNEFSRGTPLPAKTEIIYYKAAFKFIVGFEIKISAKPE